VLPLFAIGPAGILSGDSKGNSEQIRVSAGQGWPARRPIVHVIDPAETSPGMGRTRRV